MESKRPAPPDSEDCNDGFQKLADASILPPVGEWEDPEELPFTPAGAPPLPNQKSTFASLSNLLERESHQTPSTGQAPQAPGSIHPFADSSQG